MKTITIDLKSFCLGILAAGALLVLVNFKPAEKTAASIGENRRYQTVMSENGAIITDTQTGRFLVGGYNLINPRWTKGDFEEIQTQAKQTK